MRPGRAVGYGFLSAASVAALCVTVGVTLAPAASATATYTSATTSDPTTQYTVYNDQRITMTDGVQLDSDLYVPTTCTQANRCPVILIQTPYRKSDTTVGEAIPYLYKHGYIELVVDVRGTGSSGGYWDSFGIREQKDGAELVNYATAIQVNGQTVSNDEVGLAGVSYSAINQFLTVEQSGTSAVKAIFPVVPMSDAYRDVTWAGGNIDSGFIPLWLGLVNGLGVLPTDDASSQPQVALNVESQHLEDLACFAAPAVVEASLGSYESSLPAYDDSALPCAQSSDTYQEQAYDSSFYTVRSPLYGITNVTTPTFIVGGTYDLFQRGEPLLYNGLTLSTNQKKLMIGPWYHSFAGQGLTADDGSNPVHDTSGNVLPSLSNLELAWFDHWLDGPNHSAGLTNGIDTNFPTVETYRLGANRWVAGSQYPAPGTAPSRWYLASGGPTGVGGPDLSGSLTQTAPVTQGQDELPAVGADGACSRSTWQWTAGLPGEVTGPVSQGTGSPIPCEDDSRVTQAQGLTYTTTPFGSPYTVSGPVEADIYMSSTSPDSTVVATVSDVAPDGSASDVTAGTLVASMRAVDTTACATPVVIGCSVKFSDGESIEPWHPYTQDSQRPLASGTVYELQIEVFPTSATFEPGHSLRLTITTSDLPHETATLSTEAGSAGVDTFYTGGSRASSVLFGEVPSS